VTLHAWGTPRVVDADACLLRQLTDLSHLQDQLEPWKVANAPAEHIDTQMMAIVGLEIPIGRIEREWKISQNRTEADCQGIVDGLSVQGGFSAERGNLVAAGKLS
jgi:transcriptional regulator